MGVDYTPELIGYSGQGAFRFWCQKVLPLVYDDSLSYYELLNKVVNYLNNTIEDVSHVEDNVSNLYQAYQQLQTYVNDYFDNLDVQEEINLKLDTMAADGTLEEIVETFIPDEVTAWLDEHITPTTPTVDDSLLIEGAAADSKRVGEIVLTENLAEDFDLDDAKCNSIIRYGASVNVTHAPGGSTVGCVLTYGVNTTNPIFGQKYQLGFVGNNNTLYFRSSKYNVETQTNIYGDWIKIANDTVLRQMIGGKFPKTVNAGVAIDFNTLEANTIVRYGSAATKLNGYDNASVGAVLTIGLESETVSLTHKYQIAWDSTNNKLWYRNSKYENGAIVFYGWTKIAKDVLWFPLTTSVTSGNLDFDTIPGDTIIRFSSGVNKTHQPDGVLAGCVATYGLNSDAATAQQHYQLCFDTSHDRLWYRTSKYDSGTGTNPYGAWCMISNDVYTNKIRVTYANATLSGTTFTEFVRALVPSHDGYYTQYNFGHTVSVANNSDVWVMANARVFNKALNAVKYLTTVGEWDFAVRIGASGDNENGLRGDFSGGERHGDEKLTSIAWLLDGKPVADITTIKDVWCDELRCIETSKVYDPGWQDQNEDWHNVGDEIGTHYTVRVWDNKGYHIDQKFVWSVSQNVYRGYLCMFPAAKTEINYCYNDKGLTIVPVVDDVNISENGTTWTEMYGRGGMSSNVKISKPEAMHINTDSSFDYRKLYYYYVPNNTSVSANDVWEQHNDFVINYK